jgi:c-di-GMP-binding flagellar brake protein YcgR
VSQYKSTPRLDPRVEARARVTVFGADDALDQIAMVTSNLSAGGALCDSGLPLPVGRTVRVRLDLQIADQGADPQAVVVEAIVMRVEGTGPYLVAFHFVNVPRRVADLLKRFVIQRMRAGEP